MGGFRQVKFIVIHSYNTRVRAMTETDRRQYESREVNHPSLSEMNQNPTDERHTLLP